jgi:hypothetical protein
MRVTNPYGFEVTGSVGGFIFAYCLVVVVEVMDNSCGLYFCAAASFNAEVGSPPAHELPMPSYSIAHTASSSFLHVIEGAKQCGVTLIGAMPMVFAYLCKRSYKLKPNLIRVPSYVKLLQTLTLDFN